MKSSKFSVNDEIKANRVVVISSNGAKLGEFLKKDAIQLAEKEGLDLVQVDDSDKPVCRIMDYGKFLYEQKKKAKQNSSHSIKVKEIQIGFQTDEDYINIKANQARKFLEKGDKVKLTISFMARQIQHLKLIRQKCIAFHEGLADIADIESPPKVGDKNINMILVPKKK